MNRNYKLLSILFGCLYFPIALANENFNFKNISIESDQVTIDEANKQLAFKKKHKNKNR